MALPNEPITRQEMYLSNIAGQNTALPDAPITREEMYLDYIAKNGGTGEGDMKKSVYDSDNSVASAGGIKMFVNQKIGTLPQRVGTVEGKVTILEGQMLEVENDLDTLGTASTKNSTSVVTDSSDLVESGAVKDLVGWGNKNRVSLNEYTFVKNSTRTVTPIIKMPLLKVGDKIKVQLKLKDVSGVATGEENTIFFARVGQFTDYATAQFFDTSDSDTQTIELTCRQNVSSESEQVLYMGIANSATGNPSMTAYEIMVSYDGGVYEPYHASVEESLEQKADNSVIAPVENGTTASQAYAVNDLFIRNGALCKVTSAISQGDALSNQFTVTNVGAILTALLNA